MAERYANCTVSHQAHSDRRIDLLGQLAGWSRWEALGRMVELWSRCTAMQTDRPPGAEIRIHLGLRGEQLLIDSELGERCEDGAVRVRGGGLTGGDTDRFGWYEPVRQQQTQAGEKRARTASRGPGGKFASGSAARPAITSGMASAGPAASSGSPAVTSAHPASGFRIPDQIPDLSHHSHAIPPVPAQPVAHVPAVPAVPPIAEPQIESSKSGRSEVVTDSSSNAQPIVDRDPKPANVIQAPPILPASIARIETRRRVMTAAWQLGGDAFRELGREGIEPGAFDPWAGIPSASSEGMKLLGARIDELLIGDEPNADRALEVIRRRVEVAKAEGRHAKDGPTRQWITPMRLWDPVSFAKGAERSPEQVRPRAGPQGSAVRAPEQPRKITTLNSKTRSTTP